MLFPLNCLMYVNPPTVFVRDLWVVPAVLMLFCALRQIAGDIRGCTGFIYRIISCWDAIHWEGDMFHDMSELESGFGHSRREFLEGFQGDATGY